MNNYPSNPLKWILIGLLAMPAVPAVAADVVPWTPSDISAVGPRTLPVETSKYTQVYYVAPGGRGPGEGTRGNPWRSPAQALRRLDGVPADQRVAILVAAGTYDDETVVMRERVDLWGGFEGATWTRDIQKHRTILDGRDFRRVVVGANHARLDGVVVTRGRVQGNGGGILCDNTSPIISNNVIEHSRTLMPPDFRHDLIHQRGYVGGGMAVLYNAVPEVRNNLFRHNTTEIGEGAALAFYGWSRLPGSPRAVVEHNVFVDNIAGTHDLARTRSSSGGAIACCHEASPIIRANVIAHNVAKGRSDAGGVYSEYYASPDLIANWIVGNEGDDDGGAFYTMRQGEPVLEGNLIAGNWTTMGGVGGVRISKEGRARLVGNVIARNTTGGGVYLADGWIHMEDNLVADNRGGPGLRYVQNFHYFRSSPIKGNHFTGHGDQPILLDRTVKIPLELIDNVITAGVGHSPDRDESRAVTSISYDESTGLTAVAFSQVIDQHWLGRTVSIGTFWSVVCRVEGNRLWLWGRVPAAESSRTLALLPDYRPPALR
jgi:hypothetical protein